MRSKKSSVGHSQFSKTTKRSSTSRFFAIKVQDSTDESISSSKGKVTKPSTEVPKTKTARTTPEDENRVTTILIKPKMKKRNIDFDGVYIYSG